MSNFLARRHLGNPVEVNFLNIGAFQCVMVAGLGYPARSSPTRKNLKRRLTQTGTMCPRPPFLPLKVKESYSPCNSRCEPFLVDLRRGFSWGSGDENRKRAAAVQFFDFFHFLLAGPEPRKSVIVAAIRVARPALQQVPQGWKIACCHEKLALLGMAVSSPSAVIDHSSPQHPIEQACDAEHAGATGRHH
ncbi:hypothetical protein HFO09_09045 [Rhizobium laguerreae]|uniref:hypothetical protein n=1 Tax=Rhizobium laguerreae TaxID=1076926 RepID=UPI001C91A6F9|nr:hypothetical protein [Rhizobium laguerreae]MBY3259861.1 hypothetical protein [Rhizobium laguerreae]MBY3282868.1 hypothetical protein [Rhizobium laguerreae]MBY3289222.1 hypothetical protein [Rhizobium laguerreae]